MKTKEELLKKYKGNDDYYGVINAHYGTKTAFQSLGGIPLDFDEDAMKDIVGAENLSYADFIDIQIQSGDDYRGSFMLCYFYGTGEFKGEVEKFGKGRVCFKRIYVDGMYPDGDMFEGKEEHVWMSLDGFGNLAIGDCVSFFAEAYRYVKTSNGKRLDYGLRNPEGVKKIEKYDLPSDEDIIIQEINRIICESCYLNEQCDRINCVRFKKGMNEIRRSMVKTIKAKK